MQQPILKVNYTIDMECDWSVDYAYKGYGFAIKRPDGGTVCTLPNGLRSEEKALATMISATPDLLAALEMIVYGSKNELSNEQYSVAFNAIHKARNNA